MKILILANNDVGLYQFRKELIAELLKENEVTISLPYGELVDELLKMGCKFVNTNIDRRGMNPLHDLKLFYNYFFLLKKEKPDLILTYTIKPNVYGGVVCRLLKIPYIVNITGLGTTFQGGGLIRKLVILLYKLGLKKAKTVFFENRENMQIFLNEKICNKAQVCLLNGAGVNLEYFSPKKYPDNDLHTRFLFIGRVMREKGIDELFAAMQMLINDGIKCSLDIVGGFEEDYKDIINQYSKTGWLTYHGFQRDVRPFIENCHCFVLPSYHEGMANTNLECASSARPIITSNIYGCKEAVIDGISGYLCEKQDASSLCKVMRKFTQLALDDKIKMGLDGRKHMENNFDKRLVVAKTIEML